jgi:hypothetical protein
MTEMMTGAPAGTPGINPSTGGAIHRDLYKHGGDTDALAKAEAKAARGMGLSFFVFFTLILGGISLGFNGLFHVGLMAPIKLEIDGNAEQSFSITNPSLLEVVWSDGQTTTPEAMLEVGQQTAPGKVGVSLLVNKAWAGRLVADARQGATPTGVRFSAEGKELYTITGDEAAPVVPGPRYAWLNAKLLHTIPTRFLVLLGIAFGGLGLLAPSMLVPFNRFWMGVIAENMGWFMTRLILGVFFFGFVTPYSFLVRLFAKDPLHRAKKPAGESYWLKRPEQRDRKHFERTF